VGPCNYIIALGTSRESLINFYTTYGHAASSILPAHVMRVAGGGFCKAVRLGRQPVRSVPARLLPVTMSSSSHSDVASRFGCHRLSSLLALLPSPTRGCRPSGRDAGDVSPQGENAPAGSWWPRPSTPPYSCRWWPRDLVAGGGG
jgi:hypothetical protein